MWSPKYQLSFYSKLYPESFIYLLIQFLNLQLDIRQLVIHFNSFIFVNSFLVLLFIIVSRNCFPICMSTGHHVSSTSCSVLKPTAINTRINNTQSHRWLYRDYKTVIPCNPSTSKSDQHYFSPHTNTPK